MRRHTLAALTSLFVLGLAGCGPLDPVELAAASPWKLLREYGRFIDVDGGRVFNISRGKGTDIVLVHGSIDSVSTWRRVFEPLSQRYRVHALDLPGFGFSGKPAAASYTTEWLAEQLIAYLDASGIERAVLVGNSLGGYVSTEVALLRPARVLALVLLAASGLPEAYTDDESGEVQPWALKLLRLPLGAALLRLLPIRDLLRQGLLPAYYDSSLLTDERLQIWHAALKTRNGMLAYLTRRGLSVPESRVERVKMLRAPTLILQGDSDRMVPPVTAERYHELLPRSELVMLEQVGHMIQEEQPERVIKEISRWVAAHAQRVGD